MSVLSGGQYVLLLISSITKLDATNEIILSSSLHNPQDFAEEGEASIANRRFFPSGSTFGFKLRCGDVANLRFVTPRNAGSYVLRPSPVAGPLPNLPPTAAVQSEPMLDAMRSVSLTKDQLASKKAILEQVNIRDTTVFGEAKERGPLVLKARQAFRTCCPRITLDDEQIMSVVLFSVSLTESAKMGVLKSISIRDLFSGLFPHASDPPACDYEALAMCMPALQLVWNTEICSELASLFAKASMLMLGSSTPAEDANGIFADLWQSFTVSVSSVTVSTTLAEFINSFSCDPVHLQRLVSLAATIRANKLSRAPTDDGVGSGSDLKRKVEDEEDVDGHKDKKTREEAYEKED